MKLNNKSIKNEYWAYLAGLIEGHGSFSIKYSNNEFSCSVTICASHPKLLNWLLENFGGKTITYSSKKNPNTGHRYWSAKCKDIINICKNISIYTKAKTEHCKIMIEMRELVEIPRSVGTPLEIWEHDERLRLHNEMKLINIKFHRAKISDWELINND